MQKKLFSVGVLTKDYVDEDLIYYIIDIAMITNNQLSWR